MVLGHGFISRTWRTGTPPSFLQVPRFDVFGQQRHAKLLDIQVVFHIRALLGRGWLSRLTPSDDRALALSSPSSICCPAGPEISSREHRP